MAKPSPFPGMDPWLEGFWGTVHSGYVQFACEQIAAQLPDGLFSEAEETVYVVDAESPPGQARPDVAVFGDDRRDWEQGGVAAGGIAVAKPIRIPLSAEPSKVRHIVIRSIGGGEPLVTAIELISPANKIEMRGRKQYQRKRLAYYESGANVVEIDLLRSGRPVIDVPWSKVPDEMLTPYRAVVRRAPDAAIGSMEAEYYPMPLRDRLPTILIPLRAGDEDVTLDLQQPLDRVYARGRYDVRVDYGKPPVPPLSPADTAWAAERIAVATR